MGAGLSLFQARNESTPAPRTDSVSSTFMKCPVKSANFFSDYFILGGERFEAQQQESYLFGDNGDLNFIGGKAVPFPYPTLQSGEPTKCLKAFVHIRRESVRVVKAASDHVDNSDIKDDEPAYNFEFVFDSDVKCSAKVQLFCVEDVTPTGVIYSSRDRTIDGPLMHFPAGSGQVYSQPMHVFLPGRFASGDLQYSPETAVIPVAVQLIAEEGEEPRQSTTTYAVIEKHFDGTFFLRPLKQKLFVDGLCYLLQEIYGIENKNVAAPRAPSMDDIEDNSSECVICMSEERDTLILPCRHLCLCSACADSLRYQASNCPICRSPFRALLQIRALQKVGGYVPLTDANADGIPYGYEPVSLIEALNGPTPQRAEIISPGGEGPGLDPGSDFEKSDFVSAERVKQAMKVLGINDSWELDNSQLVEDGETSKMTDSSGNEGKLSDTSSSADESIKITIDHSPPRISTIEEEEKPPSVGGTDDFHSPEGSPGISPRHSFSRHTVSHGPEHRSFPDTNQFKRSGSVDHVNIRKFKLEVSPGLSLPGTPMSGFSCKSSGDSFASVSSTKVLLMKPSDSDDA